MGMLEYIVHINKFIRKEAPFMKKLRAQRSFNKFQLSHNNDNELQVDRNYLASHEKFSWTYNYNEEVEIGVGDGILGQCKLLSKKPLIIIPKVVEGVIKENWNWNGGRIKSIQIKSSSTEEFEE